MRDKYKQISIGHFVNETTGEEFKIGQTIYLRPDYSIGNTSSLRSRRKFTITGFHVTDQKPYNNANPIESNNGNSYEFVYAIHEASESHLNWIMTEDVDPKFRSYTDNNNIQYPLIDEFRKYYEEVFINGFKKKKRYLTLIG